MTSSHRCDSIQNVHPAQVDVVGLPIPVSDWLRVPVSSLAVNSPAIGESLPGAALEYFVARTNTLAILYNSPTNFSLVPLW